MFGTVFNENLYPLTYTPRRIAIHPTVGMMTIIESDHNAYTLEGRTRQKQKMAEVALLS